MPPNSPVSPRFTWQAVISGSDFAHGRFVSSESMSNNLAALSIDNNAITDAMHSRHLTPRALYATLVILGQYDAHGGLLQRLSSQLPSEILRLVCSYEYAPASLNDEDDSPGDQKDPSIPHPYKCFIKDLPSELFRLVIAQSLPAKDVAIKCRCGNTRAARDPIRKPRRTVASDLMTLCRDLKNEVKEVLYAERTFAIHVHQGFDDAGIEFLDAGRQPLHYMEHSSDDRFARFASNDDFGFRQLKKIEISIFPSEEDVRSKVTTINTYYTNLALVRLLEREEGPKGKNRMTSITIIFAKFPLKGQSDVGRRSIMNGENYWWDPDRSETRSTAIHNLSDIELVLRPFISITGVHNVRIELPAKVCDHQQTKNFVSDLISSMESQKGLPTIDEKFWLHDKMEALRQEVEAHILDKKFGKKHRLLDAMEAEEVLDLGTMEEIDDDDVVGMGSFKSKAISSKKRRKVIKTRIDEGIFGNDSDSSDSDDDSVSLLPERSGKGSITKQDIQRLLYEELGGETPIGNKLGGSSLPNTDSITGRLRAEREKRFRLQAQAPKLFGRKSPRDEVSGMAGGAMPMSRLQVDGGDDETLLSGQTRAGNLLRTNADLQRGTNNFSMRRKNGVPTLSMLDANVLTPRRRSGRSIVIIDSDDEMENQPNEQEHGEMELPANDDGADVDAAGTAPEPSARETLAADGDVEVFDGSKKTQTDRMGNQSGRRRLRLGLHRS